MFEVDRYGVLTQFLPCLRRAVERGGFCRRLAGFAPQHQLVAGMFQRLVIAVSRLAKIGEPLTRHLEF
ncbi:hypothetical protein [Amycolatopsis speibonae]|uniref:Transposase DDE domain-containing protein n=1 Tax=Amycolatopsis speibonae TaxID=1450224 RepID=A0ABV7P2G7_9PSEU